MTAPEQLAQEAGALPRKKLVAEIYAAYETALRRNNAFDFDDLIIEPVRQLRQHPEVLEKYQQRFQHILIDEYQDTNRPQYLLTKALADGHRNLCCVGDDDQSIYQFRGADIRNILDFERDYPDAQLVRLEQNYRSTGHILAAANAVIQNNQDRKGKQLWTESPDGDKLEWAQCSDDRSEARYVVHSIARQLRRPGLSLGDVAILYRTNAQSRALEEELQRSGMRYTIVGSIRFYERREIKDVLGYLRLLVNPADDVGLLRIVNMPRRGIGNTSLERLQAFAQQQRLPLFAALNELDQVNGLNARAKKNLNNFKSLIDDLVNLKPVSQLPELGEAVVDRSGYRQMLKDEGTPEADMRQENIDQLIAFMTEFAQTRPDPSLEAFLEEVALMAPTDEAADDQNTITLMTLHSAKGLEFPLVYISGLEENLFPTARAIDESRIKPTAIEEERRLFYVGVTRAQEQLFLTSADRRYTYGNLMETEPSRFLNEIPSDLLEIKVQARESRFEGSTAFGGGPRRRPSAPIRRPVQPEKPKGIHYEWDESQTTHLEDSGAIAQVSEEDFLAVGCWVLHPTLGRGQILGSEGSGQKRKLSIRFSRQVKKIMLAYTQLEPA